MAPMGAFRICTYLWTGWVIIWLLWALQSKRTKERESFASRFAYAIPAWLSMCLVFFPQTFGRWGHAEIFPPNTPAAVLSVAITALGFALTFWARLILGSNWSGTVTIKVDHELIRTGPYRYVRHPIYTGLVVAFLGTAIALDQWRAVPAIFLLWVAFTIKRLKEEQFMRQTFGEQYTAYSQTTGAIFPTLLRRAS